VGVCAISQKAGYVVGDRGTILRTEDGGTVWQAQDSRTTECFGAVHFVTPKKGWAVAEAGVVLRTINGGAVWERQKSGTQQELLGLFFIDDFHRKADASITDKCVWPRNEFSDIVFTSSAERAKSCFCFLIRRGFFLRHVKPLLSSQLEGEFRR